MKRFAILAALCLLALPAAALAGDMNLSVSPSEITIDATYDGAILHVAGEAPEGSQIVARFSGTPEKVAVKEKGKALGVLWMNMLDKMFLLGGLIGFTRQLDAKLDTDGDVEAHLNIFLQRIAALRETRE